MNELYRFMQKRMQKLYKASFFNCQIQTKIESVKNGCKISQYKSNLKHFFTSRVCYMWNDGKTVMVKLRHPKVQFTQY